MKISDAQPLRNLMKLLAAPSILCFLVMAPPAFSANPAADGGKTLIVCIPLHAAKDALLARLADTLTEHKPDKNTHIRLKGVQLGSIDQILITDNPFKGNLATQTLSPEMRDRAVQEHCDYVLVVALPDISTARSLQPNVMSPNTQSTSNTYDPYMRRQDPENYVRVKYQLYALDPATPRTEGFISTHSAAPYQAVVAEALDMLGNQVFTKLAK